MDEKQILFYLEVKKCVYDEIQETNDYFLVIVTEQIIYLGND